MHNLGVKHAAAYVALIALLHLASNARVDADDNDFIRDYFVHKAVRSVVGFSCGNAASRFSR